MTENLPPIHNSNNVTRFRWKDKGRVKIVLKSLFGKAFDLIYRLAKKAVQKKLSV